MRTIAIVLAVMQALWAAPASAGEMLIHETPFAAKPRPVANFLVAERRVELLAVTRLARADTALRRADLDHCETMSKVMPGYPQPPFVSLDLRVNF